MNQNTNYNETEQQTNHKVSWKDYKKPLIAGLILATLLGGCAGYITSTLKGPTPTTTISHKSSQSTEPLTGTRNTYVVAAVEKSGPSVVGISTQVYQRDFFNRNVLVGEGVGSGVLYDQEGHIITNYHVIAEASNGQVQVSLSNGQTVNGQVIGSDEQTDLAVVKIDPPSDIAPIELGDSESLHTGEPAIAIGNPLGLEFQGSVTTGVISALQRTIDEQGQRFPLLQTDAAINPGNSGGALLNAEGQLIGINSSKIAKEGVEGMGFAIPINEAKKIVDQLIAHGKVTRPYLGIWAVDKNTAAQNGITYSPDGLLIAKIDIDGPLGSQGASVGDIITKINGTSVTSLMDLKEQLDTYQPGDSLPITIIHKGQVETLTVTVGSN